MSLKAQILEDIKTAMKERNQLRTDTLRFLQAAVKNKEIELRPNEIKDEDIMGVIKKMVKGEKVEQENSGLSAREWGELQGLLK